MAKSFGSFAAPRKPVWLLPDKLHLVEAIDLFGERMVTGWNGKERIARQGLLPPERPWLHHGWDDGSRNPTKVLTFADNGEANFLDEEAAEGWWMSIEADLNKEWLAEKEAADRWANARDQFRVLLADGKVGASMMILSSGQTRSIRPETWLSTDAEAILEHGDAGAPGAGGALLQANVIIDRAALDAATRPDSAPVVVQIPSVDPKTFPYLAFMLKAAGHFAAAEQPVPKKIIEGWLVDNVPAELRSHGTESKISWMATLLRRPEDERGGRRGTNKR